MSPEVESSISFINPDGLPAPVGQYTNIAKVAASASTVYVAGQLPVHPDGHVVHEGDFAAQAQVVWDLLASVLHGAGSSLANAVTIRAYLTRDQDLPAFRDARKAAYERYAVHVPPPATTIIAKSLYGGALFELDAVAVVE